MTVSDVDVDSVAAAGPRFRHRDRPRGLDPCLADRRLRSRVPEAWATEVGSVAQRMPISCAPAAVMPTADLPVGGSSRAQRAATRPPPLRGRRAPARRMARAARRAS